MRRLALVSLAAIFPVLPALAQQRLSAFDAPRVLADEHHVLDELGDLDGDGAIDAIGFWPENAHSSTMDGKLAAWRNDGLGKLVQAYDTTFAWTGSNLSTAFLSHAIADFDGDGRADFAMASGNQVRVLTSNGFALPTVQSITSLTTSSHAMVAADVTGDGRPDLVLAGLGKLELYVHDAPSASMVLATSLATTPTWTGLVAAELDGDGILDVVASVGSSVSLYSTSTGAFVLLGTYALPTSTMPMVTAGDVDGDGDDDVVCFGPNLYTLLRRTGPQSWSMEGTIAGGPATNLVDVDGDGDLDGVCCGGGGTSNAINDDVSYFRIAHNDGTGRFAVATTLPGVGSRHIAGVADLEHDGDMDLVGGRCVYYAPSPIRAPVFREIGIGAQDSSSVADLDGDGDPDYQDGAGAAARNLGDGSSEPWSDLLPQAPPGGAWIGPGYTGDFDGDGDVDRLLGLTIGSTTSLELLANAGGGAFVHAGQANPAMLGSLDPRQALVLDVDHDGDLDLVVEPTNPAYGSDVYANDGLGHLAFAATIPDRVVALADLNGDGELDALVTTSVGLSYVSVRLNLGGLVFDTSAVVLFARTRPGLDRIAVGDLDGDGDVDFAMIDHPASTTSTGTLYVASNDGSAGFAISILGTEYMNGNSSFPTFVSAFDVDGDSRTDLVAGPVSAARTAADVHVRKHDNSGWAPLVRQTMFFLAAALPIDAFATCDADGDGDVDLVTDHVVENRAFIDATGGTRRQIGASDAGQGGARPTLGAKGPFRIGEMVELRVTGARPLTTGRLVARTIEAPPPFAGIGLHAAHGLSLVVPFTTSAGDGSDGSGAWTLAFGPTRAHVGRTTRYEVTLDDVAGPSGSVRTNALDLVFGP